MYKNATYKEKYAALQEWLPSIIETVKKDIKNDHLKKDPGFIKKHLSSKNLNKITTDELVEAYKAAIAEEDNGEMLAEFLTSRWLLKNSDLYEYFETRLAKINPDFASIEEISLPEANAIIGEASELFGPSSTYVFSVLNSVVFHPEAFLELAKRAQGEKHVEEEVNARLHEKMTLDAMKKSFEYEVARLTDKYEKKISGLQKKYVVDTENLKKQLAHFQRKLHEKSS
jgi:hypothetical protein